MRKRIIYLTFMIMLLIAFSFSSYGEERHIIVSDLRDRIQHIREEDEETRDILIIGDSQTQRVGYSDRLISNLQKDYRIMHYGHGGATAMDMAYFYCAIPLYVNPVTIPADTEPVEISLYSDWYGELGDETFFNIQSLQGTNPCTIDGIKGILTASYDEQFKNIRYYFSRSKEGEEHKVLRPTQLWTYAANEKADVLVIWLGTNDSNGETDADSVFESIGASVDAIINRNGSDKYIVMGLTSKAYMSNYSDVNKLMARKYGYHFLDLASYILSYGLEDAKIIPSRQDIADIEAGEMPASLRTDLVHFNAMGYRVIGDLLYKRGLELGYWE